MRGYGQFCPVAMAAEVLGERWTLLVVRELLCGSTRFSELQRGVPQMSRSVLAQRLRSLQEHGLITRDDDGYHLTEAGEELRPIVLACGEWGKRWVRGPIEKNGEVDLGLLMWDVQRRIEVEALPAESVVIEFRFRGAPRHHRRFWLRLAAPEVELCLTHPGCDATLRVDTDAVTMTNVWMGDRALEEARDEGDFVVDGPSRLVPEFGRWLQLSLFSQVERPA